MTTRTYGERVTLQLGIHERPGREPEPYVTPEYVDLAELARRIRADIKAAQQAGDLPKIGVRFSVRMKRFTGGGAIDVWIKSRTAVDQAVIDRVSAIRSAHNWDGSDTGSDYWDVNFYGRVHTEVTP